MTEFGEHDRMSLVTTTGYDIDLRDWDFTGGTDEALFEMLMKGFAAQVTEVLRKQFKEDPPTLDFPFAWKDSDGFSGPRPQDPAMLYVRLPLGPNEEGICYSCSLEGPVDDLIELYAVMSTGKIEDEGGRDTCAKVAARLRELADKLDAACR